MSGDPFLVLRVEYLQGARARVTELRTLAGVAAETADARAQLKRLAHNLRGSGAFFGFPDITLAAERLENLVESMAAPGSSPDGALHDAASALVQAVYTARVPGAQE